MFKPTYRITPFLIGCLEKIASGKALIDRIGKTSPARIKIAKDSFNRSVHSSTWIEGNKLSLAEVAAMAEHRKVQAEERQKLEVENCIHALRWLIKHKSSSLTERMLLKLHAMMTRELLPASRSGRYRQVQNYIVNASNRVIFTPPPPLQIDSRMANLFLWLRQHNEEHSIIRSALFHHEFVTIHPFVDGNGRVARSASQWILLHDGYDPLWTLELDEYFAKDRAKYYELIQQTRDMDGDYTYWIEYIAMGLAEAMRIVSQRLKEEARQEMRTAVTPKQKELLDLLKKNRVLGSAEICKYMNINRARVNQLISPLVKAGLVSKEGVTRSVRYRLEADLIEKGRNEYREGKGINWRSIGRAGKS